MTHGAPEKRILLSTLVAMLTACIVLLTAVLPAEYGWDPLGTGKALGLLGLSAEQELSLLQQPQSPVSDSISFELAPFEAVEYKYRLAINAALIYSWQADGELLYDMHSEPEGAAPGYAQSFAKNRSTADSGSFVAPFSGIHGWFWQNRGSEVVTIRLDTSGFYPYALEMVEGRVHRYSFTQPIESNN